MLSNRIWIMPTADRSAAEGTATIYFRCGSQQGKPAQTVSSGIEQGEFDRLTAEFVVSEVAVYRRARAAKQKNAARNLKKCLDAGDIQLVEEHEGILTNEDVAVLLL